MEKLSIFLVTGLSGAGKTVVADWFEDKGFYCVDNMPPSLIDSFVQLSKTSSHMDRIAIIIDVRGGEFFDDLYSALERLKKDPNVELKILFLEASDKALMRRYNESRRNHPLYMGASGATDANVIGKERELLAEIRKMADYVVDTTGLRVAQLNNMLDKTFKDDVPSMPFTINLQSFGYKRGLPEAADMVIDVRFIPNPYYVKSLKKLTGRNKKVQEYVLRQQITKLFMEDFLRLIRSLVPYYEKEGKNHLNIAFGCTGGQHRSVTMTEIFESMFLKLGFQVTVEHRDL